MKKIIFTLIISSASLFGSVSCNVLDQYPHNAKPKEHLEYDDIPLLYRGLYTYAQYKPAFEGYFQNELAGGDFTRGGTSTYATPELWITDALTPLSGWTSVPWQGYYTCLYQINEFLNLAEQYAGEREIDKMLGDAYYFRGLVYYNLVSKYRNVLIIRKPTEEALANSTEAEGWAFVEKNLDMALERCSDFTDKHYVSKQAVKALMARTKLAQGKKAAAAELAVELITDPLFELADFEQIFRGEDNGEEIFTFLNDSEENGINFANNFYSQATYVPAPDVINLFGSKDARTNVSIMNDNGEIVLNKYHNKTTTNPIIISRLAEMYLIAAEGLGVNGGGVKYLNDLRAKRGLAAVSPKNDEELVIAVLDERRLEFLGEGFRWFDLVRTGRFTKEVNLPEKYTVFPIPQKERDLNPNLAQHELWK